MKRDYRLAAPLVLVTMLWAVPLCPAQKREAKEPPGIKVGKEAPQFKLQDQQGEEFSLEKALEKEDRGKLAFVFYRSADW